MAAWTANNSFSLSASFYGGMLAAAYPFFAAPNVSGGLEKGDEEKEKREIIIEIVNEWG